MANVVDFSRLNLLFEMLTDFASVPDLDRFVTSLGTRARFLVSFSRCVVLLGDSIAHPSRVVVVRARGMLETYKARSMEKLGLTGRADIVRFALQKGWLQDPRKPG